MGVLGLLMGPCSWGVLTSSSSFMAYPGTPCFERRRVMITTGEAGCSVCGLSGICDGDPEQFETTEWDAECEVY